MADRTTGELPAVKVGDLPLAPDVYDDSLLPVELQGSAMHITGAQWKRYAQAAVKTYSDSASKSAASAQGSAERAITAMNSIQGALDNLPAGDTLIINDLTTGGTSAALSAEMGKVLGQRPNRNLIRNGYLLNPVNQRGLTEYRGSSFSIDGWANNYTNNIVTIEEGGVRWTNGRTSGNTWFHQKLERTLTTGVYTLSAFITDLTGDCFFYLGKDGISFAGTEKAKLGLISKTYTVTNETGANRVQITVNEGASVKIAAIMLEPGPISTLGYWDKDGNWIFNYIPDYAAELLKCQRYYQLFSSEDAIPKNLADFRPNMRINPTIGTIDIDGVTYWYADAEL